MNKLKKNEDLKYYLIILSVSIIIGLPLFVNNLNIFLDDGMQHFSRLIGITTSIAEGQTFPNIMSNLCNGFGYSWNIFYSPITVYGPLVLKLIIPTYKFTLQMFMWITLFLSGLFMYKFVLKVTKSKVTAVFASVLYMIAPYRMTDIYIRFSIAEHVAFMFLPMVFLGLYNNNKYHYLIIGAVGLILTHTITTFLAIIFALIYIIANRKVSVKLVVSAIFIILITSFFWAPMLEHMLATEYGVFVPGRMATTESLYETGLEFKQWFFTDEKLHVFEIGFPIIIGLMLTPFCIKKIPNEYKNIYVIFLILGLISLVGTTKLFPWKYMPSIFSMIQFTFRMLEFMIFFLSLVCGINIGIFVKEIKTYQVLGIIIVTSCCLLLFSRHIQYLDNRAQEDLQYNYEQRIAGDTKVTNGSGWLEYLPNKAYQNRGYIASRTMNVYVISGNATIENVVKNGVNMQFEVKNIEETVLELPYVYYLGYKIEYNGEKVDYYESENGFICITISDEGHVNTSYTGTTIMKISAIISLISAIGLVGYIIIGKRGSFVI